MGTHWNYSIFGCCGMKNVWKCVAMCVFWPSMFCLHASAVDDATKNGCCIPCIMEYPLPCTCVNIQSIRNAYRIEGGICGDCICCIACHCCAICRSIAEVDEREYNRE